MKLSVGKFVITIRMTVVLVLMLATTLTAALAIGLQYHFSEQLGRRAAAELYQATADGVSEQLGGIQRVNRVVIDLLAVNKDLGNLASERKLLNTFVGIMRANHLFYDIFIGWENGDFYGVINLDSSPTARNSLLALPSDRWVVMKVFNGPDGRPPRV